MNGYWLLGLMGIILGSIIFIGLLWPGRKRKEPVDQSFSPLDLLPSWLGGLWMMMLGSAVFILARSPYELPKGFVGYVLIQVQLAWMVILLVVAGIKFINRPH